METKEDVRYYGYKGITLIALIITIIVMLILAAVTINIVVNGGLFNQASKASDLTQEASYKEALQADIADIIAEIYAGGGTPTLTGVADGLKSRGYDITPYPVTDETEITLKKDNKTAMVDNKFNVTTGNSTENAVGNINIPAGLKVGDYVNYQTYVASEKSGATYTTNTTPTEQTGNTSPQTFATDTTALWRVLDISGGEIVLVSETPLYTSTQLQFGGAPSPNSGAIAYNNFETVLNNMCNTLYTTSKGTARSMTFADIARITDYDSTSRVGTWYSLRGTTESAYTTTYDYTDKYSPNVDDGTTATNFSLTNTWDKFSLAGSGGMDPGITLNIDLISIICGPSANWYYFLASRSIGSYSSIAYFAIGDVNYGTASSNGGVTLGDWRILFRSDCTSGYYNEPVRPIITLKSNAELVDSETQVNGFELWNI